MHTYWCYNCLLVLNKIQKTPEQLEQEENEKYLKELQGKL